MPVANSRLNDFIMQYNYDIDHYFSLISFIASPQFCKNYIGLMSTSQAIDATTLFTNSLVFLALTYSVCFLFGYRIITNVGGNFETRNCQCLVFIDSNIMLKLYMSCFKVY